MPHVSRPMPLPPSILEEKPKDIRLWAADMTNWIAEFSSQYLTSNKMTDEELAEDTRRMGFIE